MWMVVTATWILLAGIAAASQALASEDSLGSALNAVNRRRRDLLPSYRIASNYYGPSDRNSLAFLNNANNDNIDRQELERAVLDYLEDNEDRFEKDDRGVREIPNKRFSSSFRERIENNKERQREELARLLGSRLEIDEDNVEDNEEYLDLISDLYEKYKYGYSVEPYYEPASPRVEVNKRYYPAGEFYPDRKRSRYYEPDGPSESSMYLLNYSPRDSGVPDEEDADYDWDNPNKRLYYKRSRPYSSTNSYTAMKRLPVTKRSSPSLSQEKPRGTRHLGKTDPKVVEELSNVFVNAKSKPVNSKKVTKTASPSKSQKSDPANKEVAQPASKETPLQIKKKSINWSDYFGYDRKKKSDDEWLMERYHKAVALTTKRSDDYPLQNFRDHDNKLTKNNKQADLASAESKLTDMDAKLKNIEDDIVDDALKYTGAHEGAVDSREIQQIKDKVISQLAAAYSLEKMRKALNEYKLSIAKQKSKLREAESATEEKRVSVPRKQAVDEERQRTPKGDNNIKCAQGDNDCDEETYQPPSAVIEEQTNWAKSADCPKIQRLCLEYAQVIGNYGDLLNNACNMHQTCLLCGENAWFAPVRQCNFVFLTNADHACRGDEECQKVARHSVRYLLDLNRTVKADTSSGDCYVQCPDNRR